jgi:RimJ/RimL family protein N-acetyltransferase
MNVEPVTLAGRTVTLVPLSTEHVPDLAVAGRDESIWQWMPYGTVTDLERMTQFVKDVLKRQEAGTDLPFAVISAAEERAVGCTRYLDIQRHNRALEIGGTWYGTAHQRTSVNTECKYLLLRHAFEVLGCLRVQFKTDQRNERSQRALQRIGAHREGVLRKHYTMPDGFQRSSVMYSVVDHEWPGMKRDLEALMERR